MKKSRLAYYYWLVLAAAYLVVSFLAPTNKSQVAQYHLSNLAIHWIDVTVIIPVLIILYLAYVGFSSLRSYYQTIGDIADGKAFRNIVRGLGAFAYGILITSILATVVKWIAVDYPSFTANSVRLSNYLGLMVPLTAFWFTAEGGRGLIKAGHLKYSNLPIKTTLLIIALLGTTYSFVVFHQGSRALNGVTSGPNNYYSPPWLVLFTIVLPYVFAWSLGVMSVMQILIYRQKIKGLVYRNALNLVAVGLGIIAASYIGIEYLTSLTSKLTSVHLGWILIIVYLLLLVIGVGFLSVAVGAKKLKRIEEV